MKYYTNKEDMNTKRVIHLNPERYTGIIGPDNKPHIAFKVSKDLANALSLPTDVVSVPFDSIDDLKQFLNNIEKGMWQWEHGEA